MSRVPLWFMNSVAFIAHTNPIQAIKNLRNETHLGLKEAKNVVDEFREERFAADQRFLSNIIEHEIPEFAGKTWNDLVAAAKKEML